MRRLTAVVPAIKIMKRQSNTNNQAKRARIETASYTEENTTWFQSNAKPPMNKLSNFALAPITLDESTLTEIKAVIPSFYGRVGDTFQSSEHLWRSVQAADLASYLRLTSEGDLGTLRERTMEFFFDKPEKAAAKYKYWMTKSNVGIVAKMVFKHAKKVRLNLNERLELLAPESERRVWMAILRAKYRQNAKHMHVLANTGDKQLFEFVRGNKHSHWGGKFDKETHRFVGDNVMGIYVQAIRDEQ